MKTWVLLTLCVSCWFVGIPATGQHADGKSPEVKEVDLEEAIAKGIDPPVQAVPVEGLPKDPQQEEKEDEKLEQKGEDFKNKIQVWI